MTTIMSPDKHYSLDAKGVTWRRDGANCRKIICESPLSFCFSELDTKWAKLLFRTNFLSQKQTSLILSEFDL